MKYSNFGKITIIFMLMISAFVHAQERRVVPVDLYLIVDSSEGSREARNEIIAWINEQIIDRILTEGDRVVIWSAGPSARIIHSETIGARKDTAKDRLRNLEISGRNADFHTALREAASRAATENASGERINYTLIVSGSAENLAPSLEGNSGGIFRWFRAEKYSRWQALVAAPDINQKVRQAAQAYMNSR